MFVVSFFHSASLLFIKLTVDQAAGVMLRISSTIMGLTILAWGNSVGDTISNIVVSRHGQPQMAIGACFAAPLTSSYC
jgi:sodium/potassium/calcium exchanger 6